MIINQKILAVLRTLLNLKTKIPEKHYIKQKSTAATTEFIGTKFLTERKCRMNTLILVRRKYLRMKS